MYRYVYSKALPLRCLEGARAAVSTQVLGSCDSDSPESSYLSPRSGKHMAHSSLDSVDERFSKVAIRDEAEAPFIHGATLTDPASVHHFPRRVDPYLPISAEKLIQLE